MWSLVEKRPDEHRDFRRKLCTFIIHTIFSYRPNLLSGMTEYVCCLPEIVVALAAQKNEITHPKKSWSNFVLFAHRLLENIWKEHEYVWLGHVWTCIP